MPDFPVTVNNANHREKILCRGRRAEQVMGVSLSIHKNRKWQWPGAIEVVGLVTRALNHCKQSRVFGHKLPVQFGKVT